MPTAVRAAQRRGYGGMRRSLRSFRLLPSAVARVEQCSTDRPKPMQPEQKCARRHTRRGLFMLRRLAFGLIAAGLLVTRGSAFAQPPTNTTTTRRDLSRPSSTSYRPAKKAARSTRSRPPAISSRTRPSSTMAASTRRSPRRAGSARCRWRMRACPASRVASRLGRLQPERHHGERHVHLQCGRHRLGRVDV